MLTSRIREFGRTASNSTAVNAGAPSLPGENGLPLLGHSLAFLYRPVETALALEQQYGPVFRVKIFGMNAVVMVGPEANKRVLLDREQAFSNAQGWDFFIGRFFHRGAMLLDFEEHRLHRSIMQAAFKKPALMDYVTHMNPVIEAGLPTWCGSGPGGRIHLLPRIKQLTLDIATEVFMGERLGAPGGCHQPGVC